VLESSSTIAQGDRLSVLEKQGDGSSASKKQGDGSSASKKQGDGSSASGKQDDFYERRKKQMNRPLASYLASYEPSPCFLMKEVLVMRV